MIPIKMQPYIYLTHQTKNGDNNLLEGILTCCNAHDFEIHVVGELKSSMFSRMCLFPEIGKTAVEARCRKCGKVISVFDSDCDGYEQCGKGEKTQTPTKPVYCVKCQNGGFSVDVKYEYPDIQELEELEISETDNAFSWIWISLECSACGARYKKFVDCETA